MTGDPAAFAAVLLAGGGSRRMGRDKALLPLADGRLLWRRQWEVLRDLEPAEMVVAGFRRPDFPADLLVVPDAAPDQGPLGGLTAALGATRSPWLVVLAVDLPWMTTPYLRGLLERRRPGRGAVPGWEVPRVDLTGKERFEPLAAVYPRAETAAAAAAAVRTPDRSLHALVRTALRAGWMERVEIAPDEAGFFVNWNRPEDLPRAGESDPQTAG